MRPTVHHSRNPVWMVGLVCCLLLELSGCSLFVMAGKMIQGDPVIGDEFKAWYGQSMAKSGKKVAVLCSTPEAIKSEFSSLDLDLATEINRKLSLHDVDVIKSHKIASWIDDHGGGNLDLKELGSEIDADLVVAVKLEHFDFREENSPDLFRGRARGSIVVYELLRNDEKAGPMFEAKPGSKSDKSKKDGKSAREVRSVREVFAKTFDSTYPPHQPIPLGQMQPETFRKKFLDRVGDELSRLFYKHKAGTDI